MAADLAQLQARFGPRYPLWLLSLLMLGSMALVLASTSINVALPAIMDDFAIGRPLAQWLSTGFLAAMTAGLLLANWTQQRLGTRLTVLFGLGLFILSSLLALAADQAWQLIAVRIAQGGCAGIVQPLAMVLIFRVYAGGGRSDGGARLDHRVLELGGIEPGQHLATTDDVVFLDADVGQRSRQLAADVDRLGRLQGAAGRGRDHQGAAGCRFGQILAGGRRLAGGCDRQHDAGKQPAGGEEPASPVAGRRFAAGGIEQLPQVVVGRERGRHGVSVAVLSQPPPSAL